MAGEIKLDQNGSNTYMHYRSQVRTISFSHDGALLASASEDMRIDIGHVETTQKVAEIAVDSPTFTISWHPSRYCHCNYIISAANPINLSIMIKKTICNYQGTCWHMPAMTRINTTERGTRAVSRCGVSLQSRSVSIVLWGQC